MRLNFSSFRLPRKITILASSVYFPLLSRVVFVSIKPMFGWLEKQPMLMLIYDERKTLLTD
jgi:hypothetical protein